MVSQISLRGKLDNPDLYAKKIQEKKELDIEEEDQEFSDSNTQNEWHQFQDKYVPPPKATFSPPQNGFRNI